MALPGSPVMVALKSSVARIRYGTTNYCEQVLQPLEQLLHPLEQLLQPEEHDSWQPPHGCGGAGTHTWHGTFLVTMWHTQTWMVFSTSCGTNTV
jgi:hypothetical protein